MGKQIEYKQGDIIGKCAFLKRVINNNKRAIFLCECGKEFEYNIKAVKRKATGLCPICTKTYVKKINTVHGKHSYPEYSIWIAMKKRCSNEKVHNFKNYGGKGIKVCDRWIDSFDNFYEDMGPRPSKDHTIERIENDKDYGPSNCKWLHKLLQSENQTSNILLTFNNKTQNLRKWSKEMGISEWALRKRIKQNWDINKALTQPVKNGNKKIGRFINHAFGFIN